MISAPTAEHQWREVKKMTNEEAINICKREQYCASHSECSHEKCPWNENCPDDAPFDSEIQEAFQMAIEALKQNQWISVSERLPEKNGNYLIYVQSTQSELWYMRVDHYNSDSHFWTETSERPHKRVLAWMPLPSAYKGGEE